MARKLRVERRCGESGVAVRLRRETAVTVKWIAERLQMGAPDYVNSSALSPAKAERQKTMICQYQ
jgi:hypothetical protein